MNPPSRLAAAVAVSALGLVGVRAARADVCVDLDAQRDGLAASEQTAARALLELILIGRDQALAATPEACTERWTVAHIVLGEGMTVVLVGPRGRAATARTSSLGELGTVYEGLVGELLAPAPGIAPAPAPPPPAAIGPAAEPSPGAPVAAAPVVRRRGVFFVRMGYAVRFAAHEELEGYSGASFGLGFRRATAQYGLELSALNLVIHNMRDDTEVYFDSWARLAAFRYLGPDRGRRTFVGGALGYGESTVLQRSTAREWFSRWDDHGVHAEAFVGVELIGSSSFHADGSLGVLLPTYTVRAPDGDVWAPGVAASVSVGF
jgi:hypothetical protein